MHEGRDFDTFYNDIKSEIEAITGFPDQVERPTVTKMERTATIATIAITGIEDEAGLFAYANGVLSRVLRNKTIAQATLKGFADPLDDVRVSRRPYAIWVSASPMWLPPLETRASTCLRALCKPVVAIWCCAMRISDASRTNLPIL